MDIEYFGARIDNDKDFGDSCICMKFTFQQVK